MCFVRSVTLSAILVFALVSGHASDHCNERLFGNFDGRLIVAPLGELSIKGDTVLGFEIIREKPVVALQHRILAVTQSGTLGWTSLDKITGIAEDGNERLLVQTAKAILTPSHKTFDTVGGLDKAIAGELFDSGNDNLLTLAQDGPERWTITAIRPDTSHGSTLQLQNTVRALSWNKNGLSLIAGDVLMVAPVGSSPAFLSADKGLEKAQDTCLAGPDRAVVALPNTVVLITRETAVLIVSMSARVRCSGDTLYLLDQRTGIVVKVSGLDRIGHRDLDQQYAKALIMSLPSNTLEDNPTFLEAARIIGCTRARQMAGARVVDSKK